MEPVSATSLALPSRPAEGAPLGPSADESSERLRPITNRERVDHVVRCEQPLVWRVLRRLGLSHADADDAAQRVFIVLASRIEDVQPGAERAFLLRTASYVASKAYRSRKRSREVPEEAVATEPASGALSPEDIVHRRKLCDLLDQILASIPAKFREVFVLCEIEKLTAAEVGDVLGLPSGTVASRLRTARELVASALQARRRRAPESMP